MPSLRHVAATWLLAGLQLAGALPRDAAIIEAESARHRLGGAQGLPDILHRPAENLIDFRLPCLDCTDEERDELAEAIFSLQIIPSNDPNCDYTPLSGILFNDQPLLLNNRSASAPHHRSLSDTLSWPAAPGRLRFPTVHQGSWDNFCSCRHTDAAGQCLEHEYVLVFEFPKIGGSLRPGFTLSYTQFLKPRLLRLSAFPDHAALHSFGQTTHWQTPLLDAVQPLEEDLVDITALASLVPASSVLSPSPTRSLGHTLTAPSHAASSSRSSFPKIALQEHSTPEATGVSESVAAPTSRPPPDNEVQNDRASADLNEKACSKAMAAVKHKFHDLATTASHAAQTVLQSIWHSESRQETVVQPPSADDSSPDAASTSPSSTHPASSLPTRDVAVQHDQAVSSEDVPHPANNAVLYGGMPAIKVTDLEQAGLSGNPEQLRRVQLYFKVGAGILIPVSFAALALILYLRDPRRRAERAALCEERRNKRLFRRAKRRMQIQSLFDRVTRHAFRKAPIDGSIEPKPEEVNQPRPSQDTLISEKDFAGRASMEDPDFPPHRRSLHYRPEVFESFSRHTHRDNVICAEEGHQRSHAMQNTPASRVSRFAIPPPLSTARHERRRSDTTSSEKSFLPPYVLEPEPLDLYNSVTSSYSHSSNSVDAAEAALVCDGPSQVVSLDSSHGSVAASHPRIRGGHVRFTGLDGAPLSPTLSLSSDCSSAPTHHTRASSIVPTSTHASMADSDSELEKE